MPGCFCKTNIRGDKVGNILILGSSGFIGLRLAEALLQHNFNGKIIGYSRNIPKSLISRPGYIHISGDFTEEQRFPDILKKYDITCIYHCISTTNPHIGTGCVISEVQENLLPTLRLLEASAACGIDRLIFISSGGTVYGEQETVFGHRETDHLLPICSYGAQKASIEAFLNVYHHVHQMKTIIARVSNPYGYDPRENRFQGIIPIFLRALKDGREIVLFGDTVRDYIHIDDVVGALVKLGSYEGNGSIFNIGSGEGISLHYLVQLIERLAQKEFCSVRHTQIRDCDVAANILDVEYTRRELQWKPQIGLEEGILRLIRHMSS